MRNEVLGVHCKRRFTLSAEWPEFSARDKDPFKVNEFESRPLGDKHCAQHLVDACVNGKNKHIFIPQGDAAETVVAFKRIQSQAQTPMRGELLIATDIAGHQTQQVDGVFSADEALTRMLKGSGLTWRRGENWVLIAPAKQLAPQGAAVR